MSISLEWLVNKAKKKVYAITHAKGVVRGNSTVDKDLTKVENDIISMGTTLDNLNIRVNNIAENGVGGGSTSVILGAATNAGDIMIPTEGWEANESGGGYHLDITNSAIEDTTVPVVALAPDSFDVAMECKLKSYCRTYTGYMRLYAESVPTAEIEASLALIGTAESLPKATTLTAGVVKPSTGLQVEPGTGALSVDPKQVATVDDLVDEDEVQQSINAILSQD